MSIYINYTLYDECILYLKKYLITKEESAKELKPFIEFNKKQKKESRQIKEDFNEKVIEYNNYRTQECKLNNGFNPKIINSSI